MSTKQNKPQAKVAVKPSGRQVLEKEDKRDFPLGRRNFIFMAISTIMIIGGFLLMLGGSSTSEFNPDIFSARRIVVGPTIAFLGFVCMGLSIIIKPVKE